MACFPAWNTNDFEKCGLGNFSEGHAQIQLELAEHEMEHLSTKVERLEKKNIHLSKKYTKCLGKTF